MCSSSNYYFICRGFYDTPIVLLQGCFILVLHMANIIFTITVLKGHLMLISKTGSHLFVQLTGLCIFFTHGYFKWQRIKYLRFLFGVEVFN